MLCYVHFKDLRVIIARLLVNFVICYLYQECKDDNYKAFGKFAFFPFFCASQAFI